MSKHMYLGDPDFNKKIRKLYAWIMPFVFGMMTILFAIEQAWLTAGLFLLVVLLCLPQCKTFLEHIYIHGAIKFVLCVILVILAIYSTGVYL